MNNRFLIFFIFSLFFTPSLWTRDDEESLKAKLAHAISKGTSLVTFSVIGTAPIQEDNMPQARSDALQSAFRKVVVMATEQLVSQDRYQEISSTIEHKIYKRSKNFVHHFKPLKSEI
ncbi:MAG: hypothetical protein HYY61_00530, partial [Deltaproteobacteria bacterium]|nr:hypothetical protein [Deltaproteobacteria bacterium]